MIINQHCQTGNLSTMNQTNFKAPGYGSSDCFSKMSPLLIPSLNTIRLVPRDDQKPETFPRHGRIYLNQTCGFAWYAARQTTQGVKPHFLLNALQLTTTYYGAAASHGGQIEIPAKKGSQDLTFPTLMTFLILVVGSTCARRFASYAAAFCLIFLHITYLGLVIVEH